MISSWALGMRGVKRLRGKTRGGVVVRRAARNERVNDSRSGSVSASSATVCMSQRMA